ncbi:nucleoporin GLE1 [Nephila pilipes]|uniref:mRNA export factor GLE1 n=1 Tax=Nephila pilipes TaxID=299642 RepID=A0A8X6NJV2_NEPPI|nr:nucleoporin GLE1 [Nephila pilipes]
MQTMRRGFISSRWKPIGSIVKLRGPNSGRLSRREKIVSPIAFQAKLLEHQFREILLSKTYDYQFLPNFIMDVALALLNTSKGQIKYDKFWVQEGRTKEVLDEISKFSTKVSLAISPKILDRITAEVKEEFRENESNEQKDDSIVTSPKVGKPKGASKITDAYFYEQQSEMELPILEYETERLQFMQDIFNSKKQEFDNYSCELQQMTNQEYILLKRKNELDAKIRASDLEKIEKAILEEARKKEMRQREQYESHVKKLSAKVHEAEMKQKKAEEELRKKEQEQAELKVQLINCQKEAQSSIVKSVEKLNSCDYRDYLRVPQKDRMDQMAKVLQFINNYVEKSETKELAIEDILNANLQVKEAYEISQDIVNDIESAKSKALRNHEKVTNFSFKESSMPVKSNSVTAVNLPSPVKRSDSPGLKSSNCKGNENDLKMMADTAVIDKSKDDKEKELLSQYIATDAIEDHLEVMNNFKRVEGIFQPFKADPRNKKYRFELQKAINVPINSLSSNSGSQIKAKINRLLNILSGKIPELKSNDVNNDLTAYNFCLYLMAKQFVEQGDTQISAQHSTAFPIAMAILGVWCKKPDFGSLILGHFYSRCPYLVPFYPPKQEGQSEFEYYSILGYQVDDEGNIEEKYKFLNRISGYVRLYAAIIVSPLPPDVKSPHPHGLTWGWKWLSRILNLEPRPDITATVLYDFLDVAGHSLQKVYGKQFKKIIHILIKDFFQKIKQVTPGGTGGPIERLENFLQQTATKGYISPPSGFLEPNFWNR